MILWYVGLSVLGVIYVFRSQGIDYRLVALGAITPFLVSIVTGGQSYGSTMLAGVVVLTVTMIVTIGRTRLLRRRVLCFAIGYLAGLVLSGSWLDTDRFWWPFTTTTIDVGPALPAWWVVVVMELAGAVACWWIVGMADLYQREPRQVLLRTGRLHTP